jgi:TetR/AcrR family transcriptional repressor of nem operon
VPGSRAIKTKKPRPAPIPVRDTPAVGDAPGARDDAKRKTRAALVAAAARVFHEQGLDASLDEICASAGYTRGAFYVHFRDREDLIAAVVAETSKHRVESFIAAGEGPLELERTILLFANAVRTGDYPGVGAVQLHQFLAAVERSEPVRLEQQRVLAQAKSRVAEATREGQRAGTVRSDVRPEAIAEILLAIVSGIEVTRAYGTTVDIMRIARSVLRMLAPSPRESAPPR